MGNIKFNREEKNEIEILKCLLQLYTSWKKELVIFSDSEKEEIISSCIQVVDKIIEDSKLTDEEINIINDTLIYKNDSIERVARKYFYSDSGLRNKINIILKKMLDQIKKDS
ncbi:hypothetical protein [Thomasclavelia cocleata]|uniref:Uncharacterized protein n=1 Tax=Thomasclavelia cocleata TaxID=69824 RepID=A0A1I0CYW7_9FIRM|nr:hypothetical protein [Thomasclavelia cocleata]MCI9130921.1 hypothetical protein [Thomasclavelia cocleata]MCI9629418.1 hypothetical protein [Thomasclavelia cocleata]MCR1959751.1 hypothetical protein [Thomasclavelia cocleata]NDO41061.1 hypothetical protein [Thomasclavelia cocleata]PJN81587.1 hypothetical protein CWE04_01640 [Thomasclavelia cocleata]